MAAGSELQRIGTPTTRAEAPRERATRGLWIRRVGFGVALVVFSLLFLAPFVWLVSASLKTRAPCLTATGSPIPRSSTTRAITKVPRVFDIFTPFTVRCP